MAFWGRCCLALLLCVSLAHAQTPLKDTLRAMGYTDALQLAVYAQVGLEKIAPNVTLTALAPTNQAIQKFLLSMNLTMAEMKDRSFLAAAIVGYHLIPGAKITTSQVKGVAKADAIYAMSADGNFPVRFFNDKDGSVMVMDVHGNVARVIKPNVAAGRSIIQGIDRVMQSGDVFTSVDDFLKHHPEFEEMKAEITKLGAYDRLRQRGLQLTVFAPTDDAFKAAGAAYTSLSNKQKEDLLYYHMLPTPRALPSQLESGKSYETLLKGHEVKMEFQKVALSQAAARVSKAKSTGTQYGLDVHVLPETYKAGADKPRVVLANMFANKIIIHGIDSLLFPSFDKPAAAAPAKSASRAVEQAAKAGGRKLLRLIDGSLSRLGRRLQQDGLLTRRFAGTVSLNSIAVTSTQAAIRQAAEGRSSVADAAATGTWNAKGAAVKCFNCVVDDWGRK